MKAPFTTILKLAAKGISIALLLFMLSACQEEILVTNEERPTDGTSFLLTYDADQATANVGSLIFELDFENDLIGKGQEPPYNAGELNFTAGINGQGLCFGEGDVLQYVAEANISHSEGTLSVWLKPNWTPGGNLYKILYYGRNPKHFEMHVDENMLVAFGMNSASMDNQQIKVAFGDAFDWIPGEWHHITYSWSSESIALYIDGRLAERTEVGYEIPAVSDSIFHIGSVDGYEGFNGVMDELKIFDYPLDQEAVFELFEEFQRNMGEPYVENCNLEA